MKKKYLFIILIFLTALGVLIWKATDYYQSTYVGQIYYAAVKAPLPKEEDILDAHGKKIGKGYNYQLTAYNEKGEQRLIPLEVITKGDYKDGNGYELGTIFRLTASQKRIIKQETISLEDVPRSIQQKIKSP